MLFLNYVCPQSSLTINYTPKKTAINQKVWQIVSTPPLPTTSIQFLLIRNSLGNILLFMKCHSFDDFITFSHQFSKVLYQKTFKLSKLSTVFMLKSRELRLLIVDPPPPHPQLRAVRAVKTIRILCALDCDKYLVIGELRV